MECIGRKISNDLVNITFENIKGLYSASIKCPYCEEIIDVSQNLNEWIISNLDNHLTVVHSRGNEKCKVSS